MDAKIRRQDEHVGLLRLHQNRQWCQWWWVYEVQEQYNGGGDEMIGGTRVRVRADTVISIRPIVLAQLDPCKTLATYRAREGDSDNSYSQGGIALHDLLACHDAAEVVSFMVRRLKNVSSLKKFVNNREDPSFPPGQPETYNAGPPGRVVSPCTRCCTPSFRFHMTCSAAAAPTGSFDEQR
jgi:hypothetical protein